MSEKKTNKKLKKALIASLSVIGLYVGINAGASLFSTAGNLVDKQLSYSLELNDVTSMEHSYEYTVKHDIEEISIENFKNAEVTLLPSNNSNTEIYMGVMDSHNSMLEFDTLNNPIEKYTFLYDGKLTLDFDSLPLWHLEYRHISFLLKFPKLSKPKDDSHILQLILLMLSLNPLLRVFLVVLMTKQYQHLSGFDLDHPHSRLGYVFFQLDQVLKVMHG